MPSLFKVPELTGTLHQIHTPTQFANLVRNNKQVIKKSEFIPPKIGDEGFGKFYVEYYHVAASGKTSRV